MKIFFLVFCLTLVYGHATLAQLNDDFSDNNFTSDPPWQGDVNEFLVNKSQQLQLSSPTAGKSFLSTPFASNLEDVEWQFFIKQNFSPSGSNYGRVYLASDNDNLSEALNGFYLQFGEAGSNDAIELFKQSGTTAISVCRGTNGKIASPFSARIKVVRNASGNWSLYTDFTGSKNFILEGSGVDLTEIKSSFLGVVCARTASNGSNFFFDDFFSSPLQADTTPPDIQQITAASPSELDLVFTKQIDATTAEIPSNYSVKNMGNPERAELQLDRTTVKLFFADKFPNKIQCFITITEEKDDNGNQMVPITKTFLYIEPISATHKDIILTEIFADPSPEIGLPVAEYVEIFNRSSNQIDLSNWRFTDGMSTGLLPGEIISPQEYIILTSVSNASLFNSYGKVFGLSNFPTLNNSGDGLVLKNSYGVSIDSVNYSDSWYRDDDKKEGGWSLELIDANNTCAESENWTASEDERGGTPGHQNSVTANKPDLTGPSLLSAIVTSPKSVTLKFDEKLDKNLPPPMSFTISPETGIVAVSFSDESLTSISVIFASELEKKTLYTISIQNIYDCSGNEIRREAKADFSLTETADSLDVIVNEILFNPKPAGVDFVEVYNNSSKFVNLKNWSVANMENGTLQNSKTIAKNDYILHPFSYAVLTESGSAVKGEYPLCHEETVLDVDNLPDFNDDEGSVILINEKGKMIDYLSYTKGMHSAFIKDEEGVSLERITFNGPTNDMQNWKSASSTVGFATPGYQNSSARQDSEIPDESVKVQPEVFAPLSEPDFTQIKYNFKNGNYVANVKILDVQGHEIKELANNEILGSEGFFRWDGDRSNGGKARVGYYIVWFEIFDSSGVVKTFRKRVVVATRF